MFEAGPFTARFVDRTLINQDVADLRFALDEPDSLGFAGGQFVTLAVGSTPDGRHPIRRSYSIASSAGDTGRAQTLRFLVKIVPGGPASDFFMSTPLGKTVPMTGPHGFFVLRDEHPGDVVFAATGTGIAPVLAMVPELLQRPAGGRLQVYWGCRSEADLFLREEIGSAIAASGGELFTYLSQPGADWTGPRGRITQPVLAALPTLRSPSFYLVGNGAMITELKGLLVGAGVDRKKQIRTESFFD